MLQAKNLTKTFGAIQAVKGVSFEATPGQILGLLGPNGAGKTTTISMVAGLLQPDSGQVRIDGAAIDSDTSPVKRKIGLVPQDLGLFDELPARANLELFASLYNLAEASRAIDAALDLVGLRDRAKDRVETYSGGMKRRLNLAAALLHDPQVLLLDEPTVGVDPQSRNAIFDNLETLRDQGKTLIYTTHYMEEVERLCDRIVVIDHGQVIANDTLPGLLALLPASNVLEVHLASEAPESLNGFPVISHRGKQLRVGFEDMSAVPRILAELARRGCLVEHVQTERPTLENVFLSLTGRSLRD